MAGMPGIAKSVDDPEVEVFQRRPALLGNVVEVGRVGGGPDTEAERGNLAVVNQEGGKLHRAALPFGGVTFARFNRMTRQDRRIVAALGRDEAIGEPRHHVFGDRLVEVDGKAAALLQYDRTQIVDAVGLVRVLVGQKHRIDMIDIGVDQLLTQIRRSVDHDPRGAVRARTLDKERAASAAVLWIVGIARTPAERRARHACRGAAAENRQRHRHAAAFGAGTLENRRKKFSVVCRDISSKETPRVSASTFATSTTYDGSLRLPRNLPGAR